jgi:hypothetical protein
MGERSIKINAGIDAALPTPEEAKKKLRPRDIPKAGGGPTTPSPRPVPPVPSGKNGPVQDKYDDIAKVLGYLVIGFNELEIALGAAIMRLLKQDDRTGGIFVSLFFKTKLDILKGLAAFKIESDDVRSDFYDLLTQAEAINTKRNRYVHAEYTTVGEEEYASIVTARLKDLHKYEFKDRLQTNFVSCVNSDEMMDLANDASMLAVEILRFSERFNSGGA